MKRKILSITKEKKRKKTQTFTLHTYFVKCACVFVYACVCVGVCVCARLCMCLFDLDVYKNAQSVYPICRKNGKSVYKRSNKIARIV